eukprot:jgi/Chrpa1/2829/Chrysochromulina_OHIO_Genome00013563-RA
MPTDLPDLYLAKLAEQAGRFDDMLEHMRKVCTAREGALALEERNMLSVAFKNVVSQRRSSLRILSHLLKREADMGGKKTAQIQAYDTKIQVELQGLCNSIITLLDGSLIKKAENSEAKVFYLKMKADYFRYLSEFAVPSDKKSYADQAATSYEKASILASSQLAPTHPVRLGLALNYSVFKYEAQEHHTEACAIAKQAFNDALDGLDQVDDETYKDAALIMQLLKDNLGLWQEPES